MAPDVRCRVAPERSGDLLKLDAIFQGRVWRFGSPILSLVIVPKRGPLSGDMLRPML